MVKYEERLDTILERFYNRYNKFNSDVLEMLGETIKQFEGLTPTQARQLAQELKFNTNIKEVFNKLSTISGKSLEDMNKLFDEVAKENLEFAETFYEVKNKEYIPYSENDRLRRYVEAIKYETQNTFINLSRQQSIGFSIKTQNGIIFKPLERLYRDLIDEAVFKVSTGVIDYQSAMRNTTRQLANSGIKVNEEKVTFKSGYARRIDSSVRQAVLTGVRKINIGIQEEIGKELGTDGVEISAHYPCALDHLEYQGRQFSDKRFEEIQNHLTRPLGDTGYNCGHFIYSIILGVNLPSYSKKDLEEMKRDTLSKVEYKGKTYNKYEASQIQRRLETAIRQQKDRQIINKARGDMQEVNKSQQKITQLTKEYKNFSNKAGLDIYMNRLYVSQYHRVNVKKIKK